MVRNFVMASFILIPASVCVVARTYEVQIKGKWPELGYIWSCVEQREAHWRDTCATCNSGFGLGLGQKPNRSMIWFLEHSR
jgi:hypothetical protein